MKDAQTALREFNRELDDVDEMIDFSYNRTDLLTFADYFADGFLVDFLMQGRIKEAVHPFRNLAFLRGFFVAR